MPLYVVTGANAGLGIHAALQLASGGNTVVLSARNEERLGAAVARCAKAAEGGGGAAVGLQLDLADLSAVKQFADKLVAQFPGQKIQGLVLNAGINTPKFAWSKDGVESTFATNHLVRAARGVVLAPSVCLSVQLQQPWAAD
jgi:NAD(P)-dependent dehydrogenase (short-subunit alcohol dehydrogenase family)